MEKYITNIKELVIQTLTNGSDIKENAESGDALSCFQMGMIHLLGINTPIDFKKASSFFSNQSLADDSTANQLLGFMAECEGNFSSAFAHYANIPDKGNRPLYNKVLEERRNLQSFFKKMGLPTTVLNKELSELLERYVKGDKTKVDASVMIATICNDELSCIEAAQNLFDAGDYYSAKRWLQKGNVESNNPLFISIEDKLSESKKSIKLPELLQIIDIDGSSFLANNNLSSITEAKDTCDKLSMSCKKEWQSKVKAQIDKIKGELDQAEKDRLKRQKDAEKQAYLQQQAEEEERKRRRKTIIKYISIGSVVLVILLIVLIGGNGKNETPSSAEKVEVEQAKEQPPVKEEKRTDNFSDNSSVDEGVNGSGYNDILSSKKLSESDLYGKSKKELEIMRNSIYARYGYKFKRKDLLDYFSQFSWYNPSTGDMSVVYNMMSDNEKYNIEFIKSHE